VAGVEQCDASEEVADVEGSDSGLLNGGEGRGRERRHDLLSASCLIVSCGGFARGIGGSGRMILREWVWIFVLFSTSVVTIASFIGRGHPSLRGL
jgi:hypothetical protein